MIGAVALKPPPPAKSLYFVNPVVDFVMIGGTSILLFLTFVVLNTKSFNPQLATTAAFLAWIINWPHFSATCYRLYHSPQNVRQYPVTAILIPVLVLAATVASFLEPERIAPYFVKLFLLWSPYHFSGQSVGITMIYARRAGFPVGPTERLALAGFIYGTFFCMNARAEVIRPGAQDFASYHSIKYPLLGLPPWVGEWAQKGMYVFGIAFVLFIAHWCWKNRRIVPPIILLPAVSQFIWFIPTNEFHQRLEGFRYFVPMFHSLQYLLIAWAMQLKEKLDQQGLAPSKGYVLKETVRWGGLNFLGGVVLFWVAPFMAIKSGFPLGFTEPVILSAVQIHHFFVDGVIWKLKNPSVRSPLMVNLDELVRSPEPFGVPARAGVGAAT